MKRNKFNLSNHKLLTCNQGELVPIGLTEILPGDSFLHSTNCLLRVSPLLAPVMHPVHVRIHHWFVPHRLVWEDFEDFITGGEDGADASVLPTISSGGGFAVGSLADYLGVPTGVASLNVSALPFRGYALIYNEYYRDQDLTTALTIDETSGADTTTNTTLQNVSWEKDYFTSARPWTQKGSEVTLPLGTTAPVKGSGSIGDYATVTSDAGSGDYRLDYSTRVTVANDTASGTANPLVADLTNATAASINDLREAFALQNYAEARARYGARYAEYVRYLGVKSSDARLQRPEYLGGGKQTIQFSEVLATAETGTTVDVGDMKGHGIAAMKSNKYMRFFEEHGYVFSFISIKPKSMYSQGLSKTWFRSTKEDFFQKELQHIGQDEVLNKELYAAHSTPDGTFGYQDRYDCYRRQESSIAGEFRVGGGLEHWHMARNFTSDPSLNDTFIKCTPTDRIYASTSNDQLLIMAHHNIKARRMLSKTGTPLGV